MSYQGRISGPLLDRIDLQVDVPPVTAADLALPPPAEGSAEAASRVAHARGIQEERAAAHKLGADQRLNAMLTGEAFDRITAPDAAGKALLNRAAEHGALTARGWTRTLRLARTIADLEGETAVLRRHVAEALIYRRTSWEQGVNAVIGA